MTFSTIDSICTADASSGIDADHADRLYCSPFFRDLLEAGIRGGAIPLEASAVQMESIVESLGRRWRRHLGLVRTHSRLW
jgi:hypothetical protein